MLPIGKAASFHIMAARDVGGALLKLCAILADKDAKPGNVAVSTVG